MKHPTKPFALRLDNTDDKASLSLGKVYRIILDQEAAEDDFVRVVGERMTFFTSASSFSLIVRNLLQKRSNHMKPPPNQPLQAAAFPDAVPERTVGSFLMRPVMYGNQTHNRRKIWGNRKFKRAFWRDRKD